MLWTIIFLVYGPFSFLSSGTATASAELVAPLPDREQRFDIGFLRDGSDFVPASELMARLSRQLLGNEAVRTSLHRQGYTEIVPSPCDGPRDMVQRMDQGEFELVLATAVVYARHNGRYYREPILQSKLPGDFELPGRDSGVLRRGVAFIGPGCSLFSRSELSASEKRSILLRNPLAVPSAQSSAGYIFPRLRMLRTYDLPQPAGFWFCGSDQEVVKHVVSGLAAVGACREGALDRPLVPPLASPESERYYKVLFETDHFPTDPILLRDDLYPVRSDLGVDLKVALRDFFSRQQIRPDLRVADASRRDYEALARAIDTLESGLQPESSTRDPVSSATAGTLTTDSATTPVPPSASDRPAIPERLWAPLQGPNGGRHIETNP